MSIGSVTSRVGVALVLSVVLMGGLASADHHKEGSGWTVLFDGSSMDAFRNYQSDSINEGWKVIDGAITRIVDPNATKKSRVGDLITKEKYGAFEL